MKILDLRRLASIADETGIPLERLRKARQRNNDLFPTVWIDGVAFHTVEEVVRFMGSTSRGRPRTAPPDT